MECLYLKHLLKTDKEIFIEDDEFKHLKSLRLKVGDLIEVSNGNGILAKAQIFRINKFKANLKVINVVKNRGELKNKLGLALGLLSDKNRFEFALEKAVELGITDFFPLISHYCQKSSIKEDRLRKKAIAAMKQSKRSILPTIYPVVNLNELKSITENLFSNIILCNEGGNQITVSNNNDDKLVVIGPEGGFDEFEINWIVNEMKAATISLANRRLRSETAAISILSILNAVGN